VTPHLAAQEISGLTDRKRCDSQRRDDHGSHARISREVSPGRACSQRPHPLSPSSSSISHTRRYTVRVAEAHALDGRCMEIGMPTGTGSGPAPSQVIVSARWEFHIKFPLGCPCHIISFHIAAFFRRHFSFSAAPLQKGHEASRPQSTTHFQLFFSSSTIHMDRLKLARRNRIQPRLDSRIRAKEPPVYFGGPTYNDPHTIFRALPSRAVRDMTRPSFPINSHKEKRR
jgi:hypothetical protein